MRRTAPALSPPSRRTPPRSFTFEGDEVAHAHARWELDADADAAVLERHPDLVDMANTDDGEGVCLEWTAPRRELAARRPALPARAVPLESTPMFVDADGACVNTDGGRIGLGTFDAIWLVGENAATTRRGCSPGWPRPTGAAHS